MPSKNPQAIRWQETVGRFDGYIFVVAEYNHSITGVLKNALDQAYQNPHIYCFMGIWAMKKTTRELPT
jgi:NAD(P)H-dependent FMN reductase